VTLAALLAAGPARLAAQTFPVDDPVLRQIWAVGMDSSQAYRLAQILLDSLGPRLSGAPAARGAQDWVVATYGSWGIEARNERYGTWRGWERGVAHIDLVAPRVRTLQGWMLAWSAATRGKARGGVVILPDAADSAAFAAWLPQARGKFVLTSFPEPTCRPDTDWAANALPASFERMKAERDTARRQWDERVKRTGLSESGLADRLAGAGTLGILQGDRPNGWGATRVFAADSERAPQFQLSCEDYGLVYRLAENRQGPVLEVEAKSRFLGEVPVFNTIAEIRGSERPDEYVVLSAHFDSWDGASGATDNGTGTLTILEAMRILKAAYPNPKRTIIAGHWNAEEQGLIGSRAFAADHPEVGTGLQALLNQDNGTGRITRISAQGLLGAGERLAAWLSRIPTEMSGQITLSVPGTPGGGGSDFASFLCAGAPAFFLGAHNWSYFPYTWHTNLDTFDKLVFDDLKNNATLFAMLAYLASEDPQRVPREQRVLPVSRRTGEQMTWPACEVPPRSWAEQLERREERRQ
jgi:hypothetical protein